MRRRPVRRVRQFGRERRAAAMVEFAIVAPVLFLLVFGLLDAGRFFLEYHHLANAVREGARVGAVLPMSTAAERTASIQAITQHVISNVGLRTMNAQWITVSEVGTVPAKRVRVTISGVPFTPVTPFFTRRTTLPTIAAEYRHEFQ